MYQPLRRHAFQKTVANDEVRDADQGINEYGYPCGIQAAKKRQERWGKQVGTLHPKVQFYKVVMDFTAGVLRFFRTFARPCRHLKSPFSLIAAWHAQIALPGTSPVMLLLWDPSDTIRLFKCELPQGRDSSLIIRILIIQSLHRIECINPTFIKGWLISLPENNFPILDTRDN
ncbi:MULTISPECIES: hypothetical protein [Pseudomonas]|uniref:hypothetical protein n=1 Tax=Pseudomonas TaxID=286 RepID=UPI0015725B7F|nr:MULTISPECIES: hypothetical protein [Pseudomonas]MBG6128281.1 hypothetical protein [Pseudomonas sp. M2]NSX19327.1 hypothetical protein [Pseudomonas putida]HDS1744155.1 hypothetical protein [Pseudomonas putida]